MLAFLLERMRCRPKNINVQVGIKNNNTIRLDDFDILLFFSFQRTLRSISFYISVKKTTFHLDLKLYKPYCERLPIFFLKK